MNCSSPLGWQPHYFDRAGSSSVSTRQVPMSSEAVIAQISTEQLHPVGQ
jgi:hypothetical protein